MSNLSPKRIHASDAQHGPRICFAAEGKADLVAADGEVDSSPKKFNVLAYTGDAMRLEGWDLPVVIDLSGMSYANNLVANLDHDKTKRVGHVPRDMMMNDGRKLSLLCIASARTPWKDEVVCSAQDGFHWEASIEASSNRYTKLAADKQMEVNGRVFQGPKYIVLKSTLRGFAFVSHGADDNTTTSLAAEEVVNNPQELTMPPELKAFIEAQGFDPANLTPEQIKSFEKLHASLKTPTPVPAPAPTPVPAPIAASAATTPAVDVEKTLAEIRAGATKAIGEATKKVTDELTAEQTRVNAINSLLSRETDLQKNKWLSAEQVTKFNELAAKAVNEGYSAEKFELELYRAKMADVPATRIVRASADEAMPFNAKAIQAALYRNSGLSADRWEKEFKPEELEASDKYNSVGLQEVLLRAAHANGMDRAYKITRTNIEDVLHFALPKKRDVQASSGFSVLSVPGILSNIANKFVLEAWNDVDQAWRQISARRTVSDFKTVTSYTLTGDMVYEELGAGGEIKHGTAGEQSYTNAAKTYAKMLAITRNDIINDDLGALTAIPTKLGRGAALKLNNVFWTAFLDNSSFFSTGNINYLASATLSLLDLTGLGSAVTLFRNQTDPDGQPINITPRILLVPPALEAQARTLMGSDNVAITSAGTTDAYKERGTFNIYRGAYTVVVTPYLSNSSFTGYSAKAWYLLASPGVQGIGASVIETCFLDGKESPTIDTAEADFNNLGIQMRGYHDFGVSKQEYRAGVKMKGEA